MLAARKTSDPVLRGYLAGIGHREAIVVPLRDGAGVIGTVTVADRLGEVRTFDRADVRLLETVANHATVALQNGHLIDRLRHETLHDALTGLPNRTFLQLRLREAIERLEAGAIGGLAAVIMDLDGFKEVNDTLGHQHGDALLVEVAERLILAAGSRATVARLGGDEFAVLVPDVVAAKQAMDVGDAIIAGMRAPFAVDDLELTVSASLGISLAPEHATTASGLLKKADIAMYSAKSAGAAAARFYDPVLDTHSPERLALQTDLRQAILLDELTIEIQPKAYMGNRAITGAEALARWHHPVHGQVAPDEFIGLAERSGLIRPLTLAVLDRALAACASGGRRATNWASRSTSRPTTWSTWTWPTT